MVTISTADKALKTFYLGVLADQLNVGVNPLLAKSVKPLRTCGAKKSKNLRLTASTAAWAAERKTTIFLKAEETTTLNLPSRSKPFRQNRAFGQGYPRISKQCRRIRKLAQCRNGRFAQSKQI